MGFFTFTLVALLLIILAEALEKLRAYFKGE